MSGATPSTTTWAIYGCSKEIVSLASFVTAANVSKTFVVVFVVLLIMTPLFELLTHHAFAELSGTNPGGTCPDLPCRSPAYPNSTRRNVPYRTRPQPNATELGLASRTSPEQNWPYSGRTHHAVA